MALNLIKTLEGRIADRRAKLLEAVEASIAMAIAKVDESEVGLGFDPLRRDEVADVMHEVVNVGAFY